MDFDALDSISNDKYKEQRKKLYGRDEEQKGIGSDITIPDGILAYGYNNDVFAITDPLILRRICDEYKQHMLDQNEIEARLGNEKFEEIRQTYPDQDPICAVYSSQDSRKYFFGQNIAQLTFNRKLRDTFQLDDFDFVKNGGEYIPHGQVIDNQKIGHYDVSWCKDLYIL